MYQIHGQLARNPAFYSGHQTHKGPHLLSVHPGRDQVHFCKRRNSQGKKIGPCISDITQLLRAVPTSTSLNKELYRSSSASVRCGTSTYTPQCDKITCKAFGMNRQAVPVSGTGHALVDLAGVARVKAHGEIAIKGLTNYVYDDDSSIKLPSGDISKSETACASTSSKTKEDLATPKIIGSQKQDHWILDKKNKQLIRVHITPRKALFTPNGAKECPINPDNISRKRTTEIIDASKGGDPEILEDNWRLTSQANKPMWKGKTIFTFADNSLKDEEAGSGSAADRIIDKKGRSTMEPDPFAPSSDEPTSLPIALGRIHKRLSIPEELKKLHLQHHHMTTDQFRFRTRSLHLPKSTIDLLDKTRSECEACQAAKQSPSRSKTSGLRADPLGDMTFIDHCQVPLGTGEHIIVFVILDGATTLLTAGAVTTTQEVENITILRNYFDQYHLQPKSVVADQAFMTETWEHFYQSLDITPISLGPNTPWPNRAEAAVRLLKAQLKIMLSSIKAGTAPATLKIVTYRQLVKAAATVRNQTVTYGGVTPLELAFGRRPADLIQLDVATPTQLTIDRNEEELTAIQIKQLSKQFQEARQSEDLRMSSKPLQVKDKVFYWQEDKSKIRSDGSKGGIWPKGKVISIEGAMVGLDLGTRLIKANMTKVRKDETIPPGKPGIDLLLPEERTSLQKEQDGSSANSKKRSHPHQLLSQNPQCHYASRVRQLPSLQHLIRQRTCSSRTSRPFLNKHIGIVHVRERSTFSRSLQEMPDSVNAARS